MFFLEDFTVVAARHDGVLGPVSRQAQHFAQVTFGTQQTVDFRVVAGSACHVCDVGRCHTQFFGSDQRIQGPANHITPFVVAVANKRAQRLFRDDFGQKDVVTRIFECGTCCGQTRSVGGVNVTGTRQVLLLCFCVGFDRNRLVADVVGAEEVRKVQLGCGTGLDADGCAVQFLGRAYAQFLGTMKP